MATTTKAKPRNPKPINKSDRAKNTSSGKEKNSGFFSDNDFQTTGLNEVRHQLDSLMSGERFSGYD